MNAAVGASYTGPGGELLRQDTVCSQVLWECPCGDIIEALQHALDSYKTKGRTLSTDEIVRIATKRAKQRAEAEAAAAAAEAAAATAVAAAEAETTVVGAVAADEQELNVPPAPPAPSPAPTPASSARQLSASEPEHEPEPDAAAQPAGSGGGADQLGPRARPAPGAMAEGARDGAEDDGELSARVVSAANMRERYASVGRLEPALVCLICGMPPVDGVKISGGECPCSNIYCELCILERAESSRPRKPTCSTCPAEFEWRDLKPANMRVHWNVAAMRLRVDVPAVLEEGEE